MQFPLSFWDLNLWLAIITLILLLTSELTSQYPEKNKFTINKKNLRTATLIVGLLFLVTVIMRILGILISI